MALTKISPALFQVSNNITSVTVGGSANTVSLTFDSNGVITGASNNALSVANTQITGLIEAAQIGSANATLATSGTLPAARLPAGSVLQVVSATKTDTFTSATVAWLDVTGLSVSITPRSTSSKIMVFGRITGAGTAGGTRMQMRLVRDTTAISIGDAAGARYQVSGHEIYGGLDTDIYLGSTVFYLDSPSTTSATTYKVQVLNGNGTNTIYINRNQNDSNVVATSRGTSSITVMEIQG